MQHGRQDPWGDGREGLADLDESSKSRCPYPALLKEGPEQRHAAPPDGCSSVAPSPHQAGQQHALRKRLGHGAGKKWSELRLLGAGRQPFHGLQEQHAQLTRPEHRNPHRSKTRLSAAMTWSTLRMWLGTACAWLADQTA